MGQGLVGGVEQPQLHELVGDDVVDHLHPDPLEGRPAGGEVVLQHPLDEGLGHHRPGVPHPQLGGDLLDVRRGGHRGDAVDHAVGEGDAGVDPLGQGGVGHAGLAHHGGAGGPPVARQVVAAHDGEGDGAGVAAPAQGLDDVAEGGGGLAGVGGVAAGALGVGAEGAGGVVDVVAALGDGQRHDAGGRGGHDLQDAVAVVGGEAVVVDGADDGRLAAAVAVLEGQGVEVVLGRQRIAHARVAGQQADAADAPVQGPAVAHEAVDVHGLVGAVEAAHPHVDDAGGDGGAVVGGGEGGVGQ